MGTILATFKWTQAADTFCRRLWQKHPELVLSIILERGVYIVRSHGSAIQKAGA